MAFHKVGTAVAGAIAIAASVAALVHLVRRPTVELPALMPFVLVAGYSIAGALVTTPAVELRVVGRISIMLDGVTEEQLTE